MTPTPTGVDRPWRVGRKVGRTIYMVIGDEPSDFDGLIGTMDSRSLATEAVEAHNERLLRGGRDERLWQALVDIAGHENWQLDTLAEIARKALHS